MKIFTTVLKIVTALAAIAGLVYVIATYGDKIVAWAKKLLNRGEQIVESEIAEEEAAEEAVDEAAEEVPAEEVPAEQAADEDFEG